MKIAKNSKLLLVTTITLLGAVFLFVSFFLVVIVFSDFLDLRDRRPTVTGNMILQDVIIIIVWIAIIPTFLYLIKKYKKK